MVNVDLAQSVTLARMVRRKRVKAKKARMGREMIGHSGVVIVANHHGFVIAVVPAPRRMASLTNILVRVNRMVNIKRNRERNREKENLVKGGGDHADPVDQGTETTGMFYTSDVLAVSNSNLEHKQNVNRSEKACEHSFIVE